MKQFLGTYTTRLNYDLKLGKIGMNLKEKSQNMYFMAKPSKLEL